jgi:hypothetical protein
MRWMGLSDVGKIASADDAAVGTCWNALCKHQAEDIGCSSAGTTTGNGSAPDGKNLKPDGQKRIC